MGMGQVGVGGGGGGGGIPAGHCRWTKEGGVWKVVSNCAGGQKCMLINKAQGDFELLENGQVVSLTDQGTLSGTFGLVNATFTELVASRGIPINSIVTNIAGDGNQNISAANAPNGSHLDIPCVPANNARITFTSPRPHYGLPS